MRIHHLLIGVLLGACVTAAPAAVIANFQNDFQLNTPKAGWSYFWNANGPVGTAANYVALSPTATGYAPASGGGNLVVLPNTVIPGPGTSQDPGQIERFGIVAYTFSAADIAANGNIAILDDYYFKVPVNSADGVSSRIFLNDTALPPGETILPPGLDYNSTFPGAYPVPLGIVQAGDTIYVAIGSRASDTGDMLETNFSIKLVPEPGMLSLGAIGLLLALRRRNA